MARLHLVRHGHAASSWTDHLDPGLSDVGRTQADAVGADLAASLSRRPIWSSPLLRTQQTAAPLAETWAASISIDVAFGEIPSPSLDPGERGAWLASAMVSRWTDLGPAVDVWHKRLLARVRELDCDSVVFTHFVAINAVVADAGGRPEVMVFATANGSVTVVDVDATSGRVVVIDRGSEATPEVR